ncbi:MAG TPA: hypothetical protein VJR02_16000, partial [Pyrinomonadaceae bacterium]|nr:hypothetical protein [Pyrinomonadaceae bacterium]
MRLTLSSFLKQTRTTNHSNNIFQAAMLLLCIVAHTYAQDEGNPKRGFYPGGSYAISDIETVNTTNGNLILNIPIVSLPAGRGAAGASVSLTYNSKVWDVEQIHDPGEPGTGEGITFNDLVRSPEGGWRFTLPVYSLNLEEFVPNGTNCNGGYVHRLTITFPDGSRHEFYPAGYTIKNSSGGVKYSRIRFDGWKASSVQTSGDCILSYSLETTNTMTYYSVDGTYLRLDVMHGGNNPWTLYFPDGRRMETPSLVNGSDPDFQRTYDRNNNYTDFQRIHNYNGQTGRTADKLSDEFGRYLLVDYGLGGAFPNTTITAQGVNNAALVWTISWNNQGQTPVNKTYCSYFVTGGICGSSSPVNVSRSEIDQITLPAQMGGLAYHFGYNTTAGGWGELSSVTLPSGAIANYHYEQDGQNQIAWHKVRDNGVARKDLSYQLEYDSTSTATTDFWFYSYDHSTSITTITAPDGAVTKEYHFSSAQATLGNESKGLLYKVERPDGTIEENVWQPNTPAGIVEFSNLALKLNLFVKTKFVSIPNSVGPAKTAVTDYAYDKNGNITAIREYDWIDSSAIQRDSFGLPLTAAQQPALNNNLKRLTTNSYFNQTPD